MAKIVLQPASTGTAVRHYEKTIEIYDFLNNLVERCHSSL